MLKQIKLLGIALALMFAVSSSSAFAANVTWTDWTSVTTGTSGHGVGTMNFDSESVDVTLSGVINSFENGNAYYSGYPTTYANLSPSDLIRVTNGGNFKLTFSKAVVNPYLALVSVGQSGVPVKYIFNNPFTVLTTGENRWGGPPLKDRYTVTGNTFSGREYNGILAFQGTFNELEFKIENYENWHSFNVGAEAPVPEPSSMIFGAMGIAGLLGIKRKKK